MTRLSFLPLALLAGAALGLSACVGWLYQKIKDSFFLILGTHTCAHFLQNALGMMIFAKPRFGIALIEESDLSKAEPRLEEVIAEIKRDHNPSVIFLLSSCTPEVMKVDFKGLAHHLSSDKTPVLFVPASGLVFNPLEYPAAAHSRTWIVDIRDGPAPATPHPIAGRSLRPSRPSLTRS